jgi:2-polyprenyl-6-hydroxyphenyl methylase/3-demethylubiquinone-9 3-methyltransferase
MNEQHAVGLARGERFAFGANWARFLDGVDDARISAACDAFREMLGVTTLEGLDVLDAGSGSGLMSLAVRRLGARVHSFDFDPQAVACTRTLRDRYAPDDPAWVVEEGSVLDETFLARFEPFQLVYAWGVLHHTGEMWRACANLANLVAPGGRLFIAIYNDQGLMSRYWSGVKRVYNRVPRLRPAIVALHAPYLCGARMVMRFLTCRGRLERGMSIWWDMIDWLGGYPFEVARPEAVFDFFRGRGFVLERLKTCDGRMGCNEFVFRRESR